MTAPIRPENEHSGRTAAPVLVLGARPEPLGEWFRALVNNRSLLISLAQKEFRVRYKRAWLGVIWSIALPIFQSAVMVFIFSRVGRFGSGSSFNYAAFVLAGMVPWLYLSASVASSTTSIVDASDITVKIAFPRAILPLVSPVANLFTLAISVLILFIALPIVGASVGPRFLFVLPAAVLLCAFTATLGLALGALYVYFRDVKFMVQAVLLVWIYITPIVYPPSALKGAAPWLDFNPLTGIVGLFQRAVGAPVPSVRALLVSVATTLVLGVVAIRAHHRHDRLFVDLL